MSEVPRGLRNLLASSNLVSELKLGSNDKRVFEVSNSLGLSAYVSRDIAGIELADSDLGLLVVPIVSEAGRMEGVPEDAVAQVIVYNKNKKEEIHLAGYLCRQRIDL